MTTKTPPPQLGPAPAHASALCTTCGLNPLDPSTTSWACEHGSWVFDPGAAPEPAPAVADQLADLLAGVDEDTLRAALAARTDETTTAVVPDADTTGADTDPGTAKKSTPAKATKAAAAKA
jgi:hypothetical protein